jgi:hypothetical protein
MIRELDDTELEAVAGGGLFDIASFEHSLNTTVSLNIAPQISVAIGGAGIFGNGGNATAGNFGGLLTNFSLQ